MEGVRRTERIRAPGARIVVLAEMVRVAAGRGTTTVVRPEAGGQGEGGSMVG